GSRIDPACIGREEDVLQVADRELRLDAVVAVDRLRVAGEVLNGRRDLRRIEAAALEPADVGAAERGSELGLLGPGLVVAAPAVVPGRSCTGAKSQFPPVASNCSRVAAPAACARSVSQVAPIPIDCGKSVASYGWPKPWTASTP